MGLYLIGINHRSAPLELREQLAFDPSSIPQLLMSLCELPGVDEALILSTCNRTEIYYHGDQANSESADNWMRSSTDRSAELWPHLYRVRDLEVVQHVCRVAVGLDSLILGEPQILGQLKGAFRTAQLHDTLGAHLHRVFQTAFSTAKRIRSETAIGQSATSAASASIQLAQQVFGDFSRKQALMIGAGDMIEIAATHLTNKNIGSLVIANRSLPRAKSLAEQLNCRAAQLSEVPELLENSDLVFASTASPTTIVKTDDVKAALKKRKHQPIFMVDLAVPRDIDPAIRAISDVFLYSIDDLHKAVDENIETRKIAAHDAEEIILEHLDMYQRRSGVLEAVPMIRKLRDQTDLIRQSSLQQAMKQLDAGKPADEVLAWLADNLAKKIMHTPSKALRDAGENSETEFFELARKLFGLDDTN